MSILVKGDEIDRLVDKYCALTGQTNRSQAVRDALTMQIEALTNSVPLLHQIRAIQARARAAGFAPASARDSGEI